MRHFVGETSGSEHMEVVRDGTEPSDAARRVGRSIFSANVCDIERKIRPSEIEFETQRILCRVIERRGDRLECRTMEPRRGPSAIVDDRLVVDGGRRMI